MKKYKLGDLISVCDERNSYGYTNFYGLNINKEFMPTWANTEGLDESKYKVVRKKRFRENLRSLFVIWRGTGSVAGR